MAEPQVLKELQEELTCSICLDIYKSPVSLGCGHSFCEECIQGLLGSQRCPQELLSCPLCSAQEAPPAKLQPNIQLRSIVQKLLDTSEQKSAPEEEPKREVEREESGGSSGPCDVEVPCDFCLEKPQPAVKTCMNCETSLCQAHLGKHSTKAFLTSHVLVEPCDARVLAARRCPQHGKLLECYCVTDSVCVCMMCCATSSHRTHEIISVEEAFEQAQNDIPKTLETVKTHEVAVNRSLKNLLRHQENIKSWYGKCNILSLTALQMFSQKALERLRRNHLENIFKAICEELDRKKTESLKTISDIQEQQLSQIQPQIKEHEEMKDAASRDVQELEALRDQKDPVLFLKGLATIQARRREQVPNQDGIELAELLSTMDGSIKETFREHFQPCVQMILDKKSSEISSVIREHLTFESCQASGLHVDDKQLRVVERPCSSFESHKVQFWVFSTKCFWNGLHFWDVITRNSFCWKVGVIDYSFECYLEVSQRHLKVFLNERQIHDLLLKTAIRILRTAGCVGGAAMAKAKGEFAGSSSLEDELSCSICLSLYRNPVVFSCGHSFCKQCAQQALRAQKKADASYSCPLCRVELGPILELHENFHLCSIVEMYLSNKEKQDEGSALEKDAVPCDLCLDKPQAAVKMCLVCDASLCQAHLDKHSARASQRDHILVEVGKSGSMEERRCQEHGKVLEYFCQDEGLFICVLCSITGSHKGHEILTLKEAHDKNL
ncbi:UNVERIFIED_CONTAM: hypothetical protein H355_006032, partial [Colinus virginianus]